MKTPSEVVCDSSSIIALSEVCLLGLLSKFSAEGVKFYIPVGVRKEIVDTPITTKSFRLEATRIHGAIVKGDLVVLDKGDLSGKILEMANEILNLSNNLFSCEGRPIHLLDYGEADALALALTIGCPTILVDEKTTRLLIENPMGLHESLQTRIGKQVATAQKNLSQLADLLKPLSVLRSAELVSVGYLKGHLEAVSCGDKGRDLLFGALFAIKENGCSISENEIREYVEMLAPAGNV
jgi:predicted nucleic acid-binding protein